MRAICVFSWAWMPRAVIHVHCAMCIPTPLLSNRNSNNSVLFLHCSANERQQNYVSLSLFYRRRRTTTITNALLENEMMRAHRKKFIKRYEKNTTTECSRRKKRSEKDCYKNTVEMNIYNANDGLFDLNYYNIRRVTHLLTLSHDIFNIIICDCFQLSITSLNILTLRLSSIS